MSKIIRTFLLLLIGGLGPHVSGQDNVGEESTIVYDNDYFAQWSPVTAQDMIDRIPGLTEGGSSRGGFGGSSGFGGGFSGFRGGSRGGRGFGGGNRGSEILINGKRTAGKNNSTGTQLARITSDQVQYIEIIRGTSGELDVRGSGQVINVVLTDVFSDLSVQYEVTGQQFEDNTVVPRGNLSLSGTRGGLDYQIQAQSGNNHDVTTYKENSVLGDFSANDFIYRKDIDDGGGYGLSANVGYEINPNSSARLSGQFTEGTNDSDIIRKTVNLRIQPGIESYQREDIRSKINNWEIGGDYEYNTVRGDRFKVLFISNSFTPDRLRERWNLTGPSSESKNLFLDSTSTTKERILRSSYTLDMFGGSQDIEFGAERAQTILDSSLALGTLNPNGISSAAVGGLVPVDIPNARSSVEEMRYEPFVIHNWVFNSRMSLESSVLYEDSTITQSGQISKERSYDYVKPKLDFRYDLTPTIQLRGTMEKIVQQLSFNDFVAALDTRDEDRDVQFGNENLKQEWYWNYEFNAEYRLPNDIGVASARIFYEDWTDKIERIDVSPSKDNLQGANGNIGDGEKYGLELNSSTRMRMIGLPNLLINASISFEDSNVTDPFLGIERRMSFNWRGRQNFSFRHDIPSKRINWGIRFSNTPDGNRKFYDLIDIEYWDSDPFWSAFFEWRSRNNTTVRLQTNRMGNWEFCRKRFRYNGGIADGYLAELESNCNHSGHDITLRVTGTF
ncbi:MAG: TonB-dependent receptor plug domain-containing protein [Pseudohongiellaceae bacterium]